MEAGTARGGPFSLRDLTMAVSTATLAWHRLENERNGGAHGTRGDNGRFG